MNFKNWRSKFHKQSIRVGLLSACFVLAVMQPNAWAESYQFGSYSNGIAGLTNATLNSGASQLNMWVNQVGAVFNESDSDGMGVNSSGIVGVTDAGSVGDPAKFNIIDGVAPVSGEGESITFSFNHDGILQDLLFDGLKDETLEYYSLELPDGTVVSFFDFEVELRLNDQSFALADLGVPNPTLANDSSDDLMGLNFAFVAGDEFKLTYAEIDFANTLPGYIPIRGGAGNGARFEGISVKVVPEPSSMLLGLIAIVGVLAVKRK